VSLIRPAHSGTIYCMAAVKLEHRDYEIWSAAKDNIVRIWDAEVFFPNKIATTFLMGPMDRIIIVQMR
jgi:hypothetical protein